MTTHMHDDDAPEVPSNVSEDATYTILIDACNADGLPYELSAHYLFYGPSIPGPLEQAQARANSRDQLRKMITFDCRLIE